MGLFNRKKAVTTDIKNEPNKNVEHWGKVLETMNRTDSISTYFKSLEDLVLTAKKLQYLEDTYDWSRGQYKWRGGVREELQKIQDRKASNEVAFVNRAYERLTRDCLKVSTDKAKERKREQFFAELEHYFNYMENSTVAYIQSIK